jgi:hypothetical protein
MEEEQQKQGLKPWDVRIRTKVAELHFWGKKKKEFRFNTT